MGRCVGPCEGDFLAAAAAWELGATRQGSRLGHDPVRVSVHDLLLNPFVSGMQNVKIRQFIIVCLLTVCIVKRQVCLNAHYCERQGLMG